MFPKNQSDVEYPGEKKHFGTRIDRRNLVEEWNNRMKNKVSCSVLVLLSLLFYHVSSFLPSSSFQHFSYQEYLNSFRLSQG